MVATKSEDVTKQGFCKILWRKLRLREGLLLSYWSLCGREWGGGGCLFEAGRLLTFSAFRMGAYWRWALIRGWALIRINTVKKKDSKRNSSNFALDKFWTRERSILFRTNEAIKKSVGTLLSRQTSLLNDLNKMHRSDRVCSELFTFPNFPRLSPWPSPVFHDLLSFKTKSRLWYTVCIYIF